MFPLRVGEADRQAVGAVELLERGVEAVAVGELQGGGGPARARLHSRLGKAARFLACIRVGRRGRACLVSRDGKVEGVPVGAIEVEQRWVQAVAIGQLQCGERAAAALGELLSGGPAPSAALSASLPAP